MKPVRLLDLIEALDPDTDEVSCYLDLENSCVVGVWQDLLQAVEEEDEERYDDWDAEEVQLARAIVEEDSDRFLAMPDKSAFREDRHRERFIQTVAPKEYAAELRQAISGKATAGRFTDVAKRLGLLERWYDYRDNAMKQFLLEWAAVHKVPVLDDSRS